MEVKRVRNSSACEVCRKRRGKCSGAAPCSYCSEHNLLCVFSANIKKRGPASKKQKNGLFNFTEGAFVLQQNPEAEYKYGIHNPTAPAHHMMRFVLLAHMARTFGAITRSEEFINTARQVSGQLFDEPSYDSGVAFMLLADICLANGDSRASHYASVAWNHAKVLPRNDWSHIHLQLQSFVMSNMLDASLTPEQKQRQLYSYASQLLDADILTTIISGLMLKTGAVGLILNGKSCKEAGLLHCLKNLTVDCSIMETMGDLDKLEYLATNTPPIQKWVLILFAKMFRTMLHIQQGGFIQASQAARDMVEISNHPEIRHIVKNELFLPVIMPNLANMGSLSKVVVELYHFTQQLEAANLQNPNGSSENVPFLNLKEENDAHSQCCFHNLFSSPSSSSSHSHSHSPSPSSSSCSSSASSTPLPSPSLSPPLQPNSYSPPSSTFVASPYQFKQESYDPTLQQVPQNDNYNCSDSPPQQIPKRIEKEPDMKTHTLQPTLQLTLQQLFLQQGLHPKPRLPSPIPTIPVNSSPSPSVSNVPSHSAPPPHVSSSIHVPPSTIISPTPVSASIPIPYSSTPQKLQQTVHHSSFSTIVPPPSFSLPLPATQPTLDNEDDFLWWQNSEKVDELWTQAILG